MFVMQLQRAWEDSRIKSAHFVEEICTYFHKMPDQISTVFVS